jgi:hypothetical protein
MPTSDQCVNPAAWFRRPAVIGAWAILLIVALHPPHGLGIPICWLESTVGIPCPGCGLTRSMSCAIRGMFHASWTYHPFGLFFLLAFVGTAIVGLLPAASRRRLQALIARHTRGFNVAYALFIAAFLTYGTTRALAHFFHHH